jgi:hypothetical protein
MGGFYSFNYQRTINFNSRWGLNAGVGFSPQSTWGFVNKDFMPSFPVHLNVFHALNRKHLFYLGMAYSGSVYQSFFTSWLQAQIGYKYFFSKQRFFMGLSFCPAIYDTFHYTFIPWGGIQFGYNFKNVKTKRKPTEGGRHWNNISAMAGIILFNVKLQYERSWGTKNSFGAELSYYPDFTGYKLELFARRYAKKHGNTEGFFTQAKIGAGYMFSEQPGYTFGGGIAGGYKWLIGNHLTIESLLGLHYYSPPRLPENMSYNPGWNNTIGFPVDFQLKLGWQY